MSTQPMSIEDLAEFDQIVIRLYNLARRNGYPADLTTQYGEAAATLAAYRHEAEDAAAASRRRVG